MLLKVESEESGRQLKVAANSKSHAVSLTAYGRADGSSCSLGDGIWCKGAEMITFDDQWCIGVWISTGIVYFKQLSELCQVITWTYVQQNLDFLVNQVQSLVFV